MAQTLLGILCLTLADWAARIEPNGGAISDIVEILNETNEILADMLFLEGNLVTGHRTTMRTGLPSVAWRLLNYGIEQSKSTTVQVDDTCGMLEAYSQVDFELAQLNGNANSFRLSEDVAFIEAMNQEMASTLFYGNTSVEPEKFLGLSPRYDDLSGENADNIIDAGGTGSDLTSIWLVIWGPRTCHGIFPKGAQAGLKVNDQTVNKATGDVVHDENGRKYQGLITHYQWKMGLCLRDWRYVVRIANIDIATLSVKGAMIIDNTDYGVAGKSIDLIDYLIQMVETPPSLTIGKPVIYCNKTIRTWMRRQIKNANNVHLTMQDYAGKKILTFDEIPIRRCDAILNAEDAVA